MQSSFLLSSQRTCIDKMTDVASDPSSSGPKDANSKSLKQATFEEELENLACRFIVNLPANELTSIERIGFQVEQAYVVISLDRITNTP